MPFDDHLSTPGLRGRGAERAPNLGEASVSPTSILASRVVGDDAGHALDSAVRLERQAECGRWRGAPHSAYANKIGPFGGATAATMLNAVLVDDRRLADPIALTVNFCAPMGELPFEIETKLQHGGRTTQHWSVCLNQGDVASATASVVCGVRKKVWSHSPVKRPEAPPPEAIEPTTFPGRPKWLGSYQFRFVDGALGAFPRDDGEIRSPRTLTYIQDAPARPLDFLSVAALADAFFLRIMHVRGANQPMATVTMTTYFHVCAAELAALGAAPLLCEADAAVFHNGFADQSCALWSLDGQLVANGVQVTWYKE